MSIYDGIGETGDGSKEEVMNPFRRFCKKEVIKKTPRDYASEMYKVISELHQNEQDAAFYSLLRILHPNKHLHTNPQRKGA